jgi:hypothetical protein
MMNTKSRNKTLKKDGTLLDTLDLECVERGGQFVLVHGETQLSTSCGFLIQNDKETLIQRIAEEACSVANLKVEEGRIVGPAGLAMLGMFDEFSHFLQGDKSFTRTNVREVLATDPAIHLVPGPERVDQQALLEGVIQYLSPHDSPHETDRNLWQNLPDSESASDELVSFVTSRLTLLRPEQAGALTLLSIWDRCGLLVPLALVDGGISADSYAKSCMGALCLTTNWGDVSPQEHRRLFAEFRESARTAMDFLGHFVDPARVLRDEIAGGENIRREFKSTLRKNLATNANDPEKITHAVLKTIAAFLNTVGGVLFIGVKDDGCIGGIEPDGFENDDKFLLHLLQVVKKAMGTEAGTLVDATILPLDGKRICRVDCRKSPKMVYMTWGKDSDEAFVRTGPSTERLPPSKIHEYIVGHFQRDNTPPSRDS